MAVPTYSSHFNYFGMRILKADEAHSTAPQGSAVKVGWSRRVPLLSVWCLCACAHTHEHTLSLCVCLGAWVCVFKNVLVCPTIYYAVTVSLCV